MKVWRGQPDNWKWKPSSTEKGRLWLGFAGMFYLLSALALTSPSRSYPAKWAWLHELFATAFGPNGDVILFTVLGTACLAAAVHNFRLRQ